MDKISLDATKIYTPVELAAILLLATQTIYNKLSKGQDLPKHFRVGTRVRFRGEDVIKFIENQIE
jgi:predicted DNA-binding transcriptional regulator AlpA